MIELLLSIYICIEYLNSFLMKLHAFQNEVQGKNFSVPWPKLKWPVIKCAGLRTGIWPYELYAMSYPIFFCREACCAGSDVIQRLLAVQIFEYCETL
jgi:hypothetical protein